MLLVTASEDLNGDNLTAFFNHYVNSNPKKPLLEITYTEKGGSK
jgi:hypothetical protein